MKLSESMHSVVKATESVLTAIESYELTCFNRVSTFNEWKEKRFCNSKDNDFVELII